MRDGDEEDEDEGLEKQNKVCTSISHPIHSSILTRDGEILARSSPPSFPLGSLDSGAQQLFIIVRR